MVAMSDSSILIMGGRVVMCSSGAMEIDVRAMESQIISQNISANLCILHNAHCVTEAGEIIALQRNGIEHHHSTSVVGLFKITQSGTKIEVIQKSGNGLDR
mmetsp:Transcript_32516/g.40303  ORF Transcript_32516/g.40303 Transcript_32516/m.40303 type:complete len:101 (-) Transcript_32516:56-358(-)